jgi:hypothetical protein
MNDALCEGLDTGSWKDLYQAALFESDLNQLTERIAEAETALVRRAQELLYAPEDNGEEVERLDYAMCALHAVRRSLNRSSAAIQRQVVVTTRKDGAVVTRCNSRR